MEETINIDNLDNIGRLQGLYDWLTRPQEELLHEEFNMSCFNSNKGGMKPKRKRYTNTYVNNKVIYNCGTAGCMVGELPAISDLWFFTEQGNLGYRPGIDDMTTSTNSALCDYFGLTEKQVDDLFFDLDKHKNKEYHLNKLRLLIEELKTEQITNKDNE